MEQLDTTNIDNLYREGLAHYAEAVFAARHFELLIVQAITDAFDDVRKNRLIAALSGQRLERAEFISNHKGQVQAQNTTLQKLKLWVAHSYYKIDRKGIYLLIGYIYEETNSYVVIAMGGETASIRRQLNEARGDDIQNIVEWNQKEIFIKSKSLCKGGTQQDFIKALQGILDSFIQFLEHKNELTPNWIAAPV